MAEGVSAGGPTGRWADTVAEAVPALVGALRIRGSLRVYRETMALMERPLLLHALELTGGNQLRAAHLLGVNRNTLRKRCRELGLATTVRRTAAPSPSR